MLVILPCLLTRFHVPRGEPAWQILVAAVLMAAGTAPLIESIWRFVEVGRGTLMPAVPTEHLVVSGLYRFVRNPMYVGVLTALAGETLLFARRSMVIYWWGWRPRFISSFWFTKSQHFRSGMGRTMRNSKRWFRAGCRV